MTGAQIRQAREAAGLTQEQLAALVGVSMRTVGNWERGATVPLNRAGRLRQVLHVSGEPVDLRQVPDAELLAEVARRFARSTPAQERPSEA